MACQHGLTTHLADWLVLVAWLQVLMQLVAALRAAGHFTVVALTQPFEFEGAAKAEQASKLVAALRASAHLVAVMEQDVLMQVGDSACIRNLKWVAVWQVQSECLCRWAPGAWNVLGVFAKIWLWAAR